jgi:flagellar hook-associated protein FlgK
MQDLGIGISGLKAAQQALSVIGNNVANAATEGYHRQRINLSPADVSTAASGFFGGGVDVAGVSRMVDQLLEQEILRQRSSLEQVSRELATLRTVENAFAELSEGSSLSATIDEFFTALEDLCAHPSETIWQNQAVTAAETMAERFRRTAKFLTDVQAQIKVEAENIVERLNTLTRQIAELNSTIKDMEIKGGQTNNLRDQRDRLTTELSELVGVEIQSREYGAVDISISGTPVVSGGTVIELQVGLTENDWLGIAPEGTYNYDTEVEGGKLGGLVSLKNDLILEMENQLDALAECIIKQTNQHHVQGVGSEGSFTQLTGWQTTSGSLSDIDGSIGDGTIYIRVINTETQEVTRHEIDVDVSTDSLSTIAAKINAVDGLQASVVSSKLKIQAEANCEFDFLPAVLSEPSDSNLTAASPPAISVSGIYTGSENQTFTLTATGSGSVGNGDLQLEVKNGAGEVVSIFNIGAGYAAGEKLLITDGIRVSVGVGDLNTDDTFEVDAYADTDTSGLLAAIGMNTFFCGSSAADIAICSDIKTAPDRIATSIGADFNDNVNVRRLAGLKDRASSELKGMTPEEYYHNLSTYIGHQTSIKQMERDNMEIMVQDLINRQSEMSGVNINEEAAQMVVFEQMFQAMAKYLATIQTSLASIMQII